MPNDYTKQMTMILFQKEVIVYLNFAYEFAKLNPLVLKALNIVFSSFFIKFYSIYIINISSYNN